MVRSKRCNNITRRRKIKEIYEEEADLLDEDQYITTNKQNEVFLVTRNPARTLYDKIGVLIMENRGKSSELDYFVSFITNKTYKFRCNL